MPFFWRLACRALPLLLLSCAAARAADIPPDQRQAIETIIHDYLIKNPEVLLDALQAAEDHVKSETKDKVAKALRERHREIFDDPATPVGGNPKGDVSLVEFFDYRCPYCKQVQPSIQSLLGEDRQLRFVYKELPVLGRESVLAARAALAARAQGKYEAFHTVLMASKGQLGEDVVYKLAASVGLDVERLKRDMGSHEIERILKANLDLADALEIHGTPGFIVGDQIVPGAIDLGAMKQLIADARKH
jgi:protein-disulfide isomerase